MGHSKFGKWKGVGQPEFGKKIRRYMPTWSEPSSMSIYLFDIITACDKFWHCIKFHRSQQFAFLFLEKCTWNEICAFPLLLFDRYMQCSDYFKVNIAFRAVSLNLSLRLKRKCFSAKVHNSQHFTITYILFLWMVSNSTVVSHLHFIQDFGGFFFFKLASHSAIHSLMTRSNGFIKFD